MLGFSKHLAMPSGRAPGRRPTGTAARPSLQRPTPAASYAARTPPCCSARRALRLAATALGASAQAASRKRRTATSSS